jgi:hypothetical protein
LKVFRLLEHDTLNTEVALLNSLRELVQADRDESLLVISNGIFLGLIRELADVPPASIKRSALCNLLRQAVVTASTALETYLPLFVANKMISSLNFSYLNGRRGIHITGMLLGLDNPWSLIATQLGRTEEEIKKTLDTTVKRRNDIVHRADQSQDDPAGAAQEIGFPWAKQAVETIRVVCLALDDLVSSRLKELKQQAAELQPQRTSSVTS